LSVPHKRDVDALAKRVAELITAVEELSGKKAARAKPPVRAAAAKPKTSPVHAAAAKPKTNPKPKPKTVKARPVATHP
jgi:hypothetical protein